MFIVTSDFASTPIVPANSHGPYLVVGGSPVLLSAGVAHPSASYHWELGDGTTATTPDVTHRYGHSGIYVAKLTVTVNDSGGAVTRHFATIDVQNVPPTVNAGSARTVNEGDVVPFTASFTDPQWLDTHTASWDWGDSQPRSDGVVVESHLEPQGTGTVGGSHAWGDAGDYVAVLSVRDDAGGVGQAQVPVTVLNVPPKVEAGLPMYAYPCTVITLRGKFIDPGWLDRHIGFWDFGDCVGRQAAVLRETNLPPRAAGTVIASHVYERCGIYFAICLVMDDDGAFGQDQTEVHVIDVVNRGFEHGFHGDRHGSVANGWQEYTGADSAGPLMIGIAYVAPAADDIFVAEEMLVHGGERAQRIRFEGTGNAGILQCVGANKAWDYQITAWYSLHPQAGGASQAMVDENDIPPDPLTAGVARLGIDPLGGTDPRAASVVWSEGRMRGEWAQLAVRAVAERSQITIFLEGMGDEGLKTDVAFDDVALIPVQPFCVEKEPEEPQPERPKPEERCVDFRGMQCGDVPPHFERDGFIFICSDKQAQQIVAWGEPAAVPKLEMRSMELIVLPFVATQVELTLFAKAGAVRAIARDAHDKTLVESQSTGSGVEVLTLDANGIVEVQLVARGGETLIVKVCASRAAGGDKGNVAVGSRIRESRYG
jgi:hypothetical protein